MKTVKARWAQFTAAAERDPLLMFCAVYIAAMAVSMAVGIPLAAWLSS